MRSSRGGIPLAVAVLSVIILVSRGELVRWDDRLLAVVRHEKPALPSSALAEKHRLAAS